MTVIILYSGNSVGLAQLLISLQPQLHPDDDIYIIDNSKKKSAKKIAMMYGSTRCYIFVEVTKKKGRAALKFGLQSMKENKQEGALVISDRCVISCTFISNLKKAASFDDWGILLPQVSETKTMLDQNFRWFNPKTTVVARIDKEESALHDAVMYVKTREINEDLSVNYMSEIAIGYFGNELVGILPEYKDPD